jgi:hypothetical protein
MGESGVAGGRARGQFKCAGERGVVHKERGESRSLGLDVDHELVEPLPAGYVQSATAMVGVFLDNFHVVGRCVLTDNFELVFWRILLVLG